MASTELTSDWKHIPIPFNSANFSAHAMYESALGTMSTGKFEPLRLNVHSHIKGANLSKSTDTSMQELEVGEPLPTTYTFSFPHQPNSSVSSQPVTPHLQPQHLRERKPVYTSTVPVTLSNTQVAEKHKYQRWLNNTLWGFQKVGSFLKWSLADNAWPAVKWTFFKTCTLVYFLYRKAVDKKPQALPLPGPISTENPGWRVQAAQLAYEMNELKTCFAQIAREMQFPAKFALEITFTDGESKQVVATTLLINSKEEWSQLGTVSQDLYDQVVLVRGEKDVSSKYKMDVAFAVVSKGVGKTSSIYQRSNTYCESMQESDLVKQVSQKTCKGSDVNASFKDIHGISTTRKWVADYKNWKLSDKALATYDDGSGQPIPLIVADK